MLTYLCHILLVLSFRGVYKAPTFGFIFIVIQALQADHSGRAV
jgi:hypothetical protein